MFIKGNYCFFLFHIGVKALQTTEGNFSATLSGCESDMRFVYCAACISYMLNDWSGFDIERATNYIIKSIVSITFYTRYTDDYLK
jgi:prenyltransferase beta subunit